MILLLDVCSPIPEFHIINDNKIINSTKIVQNTNQKLSDNLISTYLKISNSYDLYNNIKKFIITIGPGSYTALRVGVSFISGISQAVDLPVSLISTETIYNFSYEDNKQKAIYFESSNNQKFLSYKKDSKFIHEKIETDKYLLSTYISHIFYNNQVPSFINQDIILISFKIKEIVIKNIQNLDFKKNIIIKPIYISNNPLLN